MLRPIIAPSVLASDFGQLTAECKRMIKGGAEWLHMGNPSPRHTSSNSLKTLWMGKRFSYISDSFRDLLQPFRP